MLSLVTYHREVSSKAQVSLRTSRLLQPPSSSARRVPPTFGRAHRILAASACLIEACLVGGVGLAITTRRRTRPCGKARAPALTSRPKYVERLSIQSCPLGGLTCPLGGLTCPQGGLTCPLGGLIPLGGMLSQMTRMIGRVTRRAQRCRDNHDSIARPTVAGYQTNDNNNY